MNARARPQPVKQAIKSERLYQRVAGRVRGQLGDPKLRPGGRLPSEIAPSPRLGVDRPSVRGLLAMNRGPRRQSIRGRVDTVALPGEGVAFRKRLIAIRRRRDACGARASMRRRLERIGRIRVGESLDKPRRPADASPAVASRKPGERR